MEKGNVDGKTEMYYLEIKSEKPNEAAPNKFFKCPLRRSL